MPQIERVTWVAGRGEKLTGVGFSGRRGGCGQFLAYTGVRFGEMAALRVGRLDLDRQRAAIVESVTVVQGRGLVWGPPKTHERREVPIPRSL